MTVGEMIKLLRGLKEDMDIIMMVDDEIFKPVCCLDSQIVTLKDEVTGDTDKVVLLCPCSCDEEDFDDEIEKGEINSQPELN